MARMLVFAAALCWASAAMAADIHVPADYPTIQQAIDASQPGDTVIVAPDTYHEAINFGGKAITVRSAAPGNAEITVIDASGLDTSAVIFNSGEGADSVLDGFTITGGAGVDFGSMRAGGGVFFTNSSNPTIVNCIIRGNTADIGGAMMHLDSSSPLIVNTLIAENTANNQGGGASHFSDSNPTYINCTFAYNIAPFGGAIDIATFCHPTLINCIVWGNDQSGFGQFSGFPHVRDSIVEGGYDEGVNIIEDDPLFTDPDAGDYRPAEGSPAIDAGDTTALPDDIDAVETDLDGNPRIVDGDGDGRDVIDIGPYEFQPDAETCPGDLTGNGSVGVPDLLVLLSCWGPVDPGSDCEQADLTGNGSVGVPDLLQLLSLWGPCPD